MTSGQDFPSDFPEIASVYLDRPCQPPEGLKKVNWATSLRKYVGCIQEVSWHRDYGGLADRAGGRNEDHDQIESEDLGTHPWRQFKLYILNITQYVSFWLDGSD